MILLVTEELLKLNLLTVTVLAPESVEAGWKQWEHVPNAA